MSKCVKELYLSNNSLTVIPNSISSVTNLQSLTLRYCGLTKPPYSIDSLTKLRKLYIDESSYQIDNLDPECEILVIGSIQNKITNLPVNLKELYLKKDIDISMIKIPFGCEIKYDYDSILPKIY